MPNHSWTLFFSGEVQAPLKLLIGGFLSTPLSHSDMSHYSYVLAWWNAGLLWQNQRESASLHAKNLSSLYSFGVFVCVGSLNRMNVNDLFDFTWDSQSVWAELSNHVSSPFLKKHMSCSQGTFFIYCIYFKKFTHAKQSPTTSRIWIHNDNGSVNRLMKAGMHQPFLNQYCSN